ncbi:MAG: T9SS type A sorting domain-containing protein [Flavobacteriales bacterium]|nr:T9SS type A sorting domain-containing protein [Flavobacteriales bacterium]
MKTHLPTLTAALMLAGGICAQPTLDQASNGLAPIASSYGITSYTTNDMSTTYWEGAAGANADYGFWMVESNGGNDRYMVDPAATPTSATFPTATVLVTNGGQDTIAYKVDANGMEIVGVRTSVEGTVAMTDPSKELVFPCTFGTSWTDPYVLNFTVAGFPVVRSGTITGIADGYGTLELPAANLENVLRVKVRKAQTDIAAIANVYRSYNSYYYYSTDVPYPVMRTSIDTVINGGGTPVVTYVAEWLFGPGTGISEVDPGMVAFTPYPNPSNGRVDLGMGAEELRSVEVFTSAGALVSATVRTITSAANSVVDLSGLPAGLYTVKVTSVDGRTGTRRVVLE